MAFVRGLTLFLVLLIGGALVAAGVFVLGVRNRNPRVLRFARAVQRDLLNPMVLRDAGSSGSPWAVVRTPGRVTGRVYDTPVGVQRVDDELYISLPYGPRTQWARNVRAAGGATVLHRGDEIEATAPELVPIRQSPLAPLDRLAIGMFGMTHALRLHVVSSVPLSAL
jgi:deazaflavin-dependent oxidoreductase (nitroreductase family)